MTEKVFVPLLPEMGMGGQMDKQINGQTQASIGGWKQYGQKYEQIFGSQKRNKYNGYCSKELDTETAPFQQGGIFEDEEDMGKNHFVCFFMA